jgi:hypothetical protein
MATRAAVTVNVIVRFMLASSSAIVALASRRLEHERVT